MTRKQALLEVLQILETQQQTKQICEIKEKINEILSELPITSWSKQTIFDTLDQFAIDNNRNPTVTDLKLKDMPSHPSIANRFKMSANDFLSLYYPKKCSSKIFSSKTKEEWLELFIIDYEKIKPYSADEYNKNRGKNQPAWNTLAKMFDFKSWERLKSLAKVKTYNRHREVKENKINFNIDIHTNFDDEIKRVFFPNQKM